MVGHQFKNLGKDIFSYGLMGGIGKIVGLILLPIFTRVFSVDEYGLLDILATLVGLLTVTGTLSLPGSLMRYYGNAEKTPDKESLYSSILYFSLLVNFFIAALIFFFSEPISLLLTDKNDYSIFIKLSAFAALFDAVSRLPEAFLRRQRKIYLYSFLNIGASVLYALMALISVLIFDLGLLGVFGAQVVANLLKLISGLFFTKKWVSFLFNRQYLRVALKYSLPFFPALFVNWANNQSNRIILLYIIGLSGVGIFSAGAKIASIVVLLTEVFKKAWDPFSVEILGEQGRDIIYKKTLKYYFGLFTLIALLVAGFAPDLIHIVIPKEYFDGYYILPWLIGAIVIHDGGAVINIGTIITEKTWANSVAAWSGFIVNVAVSILLIHLLGVIGAAIGMFIAEIISKIILWKRSARLTNIVFNKSYIVKLLVIYIISSIAVLMTTSYLIEYPLISFAVRAAITISVCMFIIRFTIDPDLIETLKQLLSKSRFRKKQLSNN